MSTSDATIRNSLRASTLLNRPKTAPMGPRTRKSRINLVEESLLDTSKSLSSTLDLEEFGGRSLSRPNSFTPSSFSLISPPSSPSSTSFLSDRMSFPAVSEEPMSPLVSVHASEEEEIHYLHTPNTEDSSAKVSSVDAAASTPPKLVPPPGMKFESNPVPWKALPLEAALWMLDSNELQNIVARAIQSSESFVRLVSLENIDNVLPAELKRLDTLRSVTQSKYRFLIHRRTMLFQALNSSLIGAKPKNGDTLVIGGLASQLADTIAECEKLSEELLSISDQMAQINKLIDIHLGSAFAVALRKLNGSLSRRITELGEAKERITQLEIDVQEAWKEAEKVAKELDDYETELIDDTEAIIEVAEVVSVQPSSSSFSRRPSTPTLLSIASPINPPTSPMASQFGFSPPIKEKENEAEDVPDSVSIRSSHSTRSAKSIRQRGGEMSRTSSVLAAKRRSHRASQSSLRLTSGHSRKQSIARLLQSPQEEHPPVPELPLQFNDNAIPTWTPRASSTLLALDASTPSLHRRGSLDTICTFRSPATSAAVVAFRGRSADDMYLRPYNSSSSEIQLVRRSQVYNYTSPENEEKSVFETDSSCDIPSNVVTASKNIPSMWTNVDALNIKRPHTSPSPASSMKTTYSKLKTLTKRYSATLPIFSHKPSRVTTRPRPQSD